MKMKRFGIYRPVISAGFLISLASASICDAADPIVQTNFTADPAPMVHNGVVYLYTSHDDDNAPAGQGRFLMLDWKCYSSADMVNWTDHGTVASLRTFPWAVQENDAWAPHVIERNGKFYFYAPVSVPGWPKNVIAVAVADNPLGTFKDALGRPLIDKENGYIDPGVFIDDDGQAYLYFGNPQVWYVKLNEDMISYSGEVITDSSFVKVSGGEDPYHYQEGPWPFKRNGKYYLAYAATCCPEGIGYAMSDSPAGPWDFKGYIMPPDNRSTGNHPGVIDLKGGSYVFGFNFKLNFAITEQHHERRSVCVAKIEYNPDGTIQELPWWEEADNVPQIEPLNPYARTEAETMAWSEGLKTEKDSLGVYVTDINNNDYLIVRGADFGKGVKTFQARAASLTGGKIEIRLENQSGPILGICEIKNNSNDWRTFSAKVNKTKGIHDLCFFFKGDAGELFELDYWKFD